MISTQVKLKHLDIEYNVIDTVEELLIDNAGAKLDQFYFSDHYDDLDEEIYFDGNGDSGEEWDGADDYDDESGFYWCNLSMITFGGLQYTNCDQ